MKDVLIGRVIADELLNNLNTRFSNKDSLLEFKSAFNGSAIRIKIKRNNYISQNTVFVLSEVFYKELEDFIKLNINDPKIEYADQKLLFWIEE